jgi:hypothetical protein
MEREGWHISKHDQLRKLCVLAATGDISSVEAEQVQVHLRTCQSCRLLLTELRDVHALDLVHVPSSADYRDSERETRLKDSILRAARAESLRVADPAKSLVDCEKAEIRIAGPIQGFRRWSMAASLSVLAACLAFAFVLKPRLQWIGHRPVAVAGVATAAVPPISEASVGEKPNRDEELLRAKLAKLEADRLRLEHLLQESQSQNSILQNSTAAGQQQVVALTKELESAREEEARASQMLKQLSVERQSDQTAIAAQNREIRSLNEKLEDQTNSQDRNQNLVQAESDLRELVGARNLHIVDVYDTDSKGKTKKAVGRVFYTEGKSLVFYAYDLSDGRSSAAKYAYYVWGNKDGNLETVRNLGTLGADDQLQKRWKLQINDANVLADIDRVFVTVEAVGKLGPRPHGRQILSAYLGGPVNHP